MIDNLIVGALVIYSCIMAYLATELLRGKRWY